MCSSVVQFTMYRDEGYFPVALTTDERKGKHGKVRYIVFSLIATHPMPCPSQRTQTNLSPVGDAGGSCPLCCICEG